MSYPLSQMLLAHAAEPLRVPASAALEQGLHRLHQQGQAAHPRIALPAPLFIDHIASVVSAGDLDADALCAKLRGEDLYLAAACTHDVPGAAAALSEVLSGLLPPVLSKMGQDPSFLDEVHQRAMEKLLIGGAQTEPAIRGYRGQGALRSWLSVMVVRLGLNLLREKGSELPVQDPTAHLERAMEIDREPEMAALRHRYAAQFSAALREAAAQLGKDERLLMDQYHRQGQRLEQIAALMGVNHTTVMRRLTRARAQMLQVVKASLARQLGINSEEFRELMPLVYSRIDVSMSSMFGRHG